jgi:hypothetical protein
MIKRCVTAVAVALFAISSAAQAGKGKEDQVWPAEAIKWEDGPIKGTHVAKLWGDWTKGGPFGNLIKFDAGSMHPLHKHTQTLKLVIVSGTLIYHPMGGKETKLGPGSYLSETQPHVSGCTKDADCVFFMTAKDKFDFIELDESGNEKKPEEKKAEEKKP